MPRFDPDSILLSSRPLVINGSNKVAQTGRQGLVVDFALYRQLPPVDRERYRADVFAFIDRTRTQDNDRSSTKEKFSELFAQADQGKSIRPYGNFGTTLFFGALPDSKLNIVLLDNDTRYLAENIEGIKPENELPLAAMRNDKNESLARYFVVHHELGHALYGLDQAGSDFAGAALTMRYMYDKHPENASQARQVMLMIADNRLIRGMRGSEAGENGYEPYMAIRRGLAMNPIELDNLTDAEIMSRGRELDTLWQENSKLGDDQPELRVARAIHEFEKLTNKANDVFAPNSKQDFTRLHELLTRMGREDNNPFERGSTEYYILKEYTDAAGRLSRGYNADVSLPAQQPQLRFSLAQPS